MRIAILCVAFSGLLAGAETVQLFNGRDLTGWESVGYGRFAVENGTLKTEGGMGLLWYKGRKFGNETLRVVFKTTGPKDNSGVYIRMPEPPTDPWYGVHNGFEVQIDGAGDEWHSTGAIYSLSKVAKQAQKTGGEWNTMEIQLDGPVTRVTLNGELVNEFKPDAALPDRKEWFEPVRGPRPDYGYIGLQNHDPGSTVYFREVSVVTPGTPLSRGDRDRMLSYLHATRKQIVDAVAGLSTEHLNYKPAPDRWSAAEIVEHLARTEPMLFGSVQNFLRLQPVANAQSQLKDEEVVNRMKDRSQRAEAPPSIRPVAKWTGAAELLEEFTKQRDRTVQWANETQADLRGRVRKTYMGEISAYQMLLIIPAHTERHLAQLNEVKASEGFPKK